VYITLHQCISLCISVYHFASVYINISSCLYIFICVCRCVSVLLPERDAVTPDNIHSCICTSIHMYKCTCMYAYMCTICIHVRICMPTRECVSKWLTAGARARMHTRERENERESARN